MSPQNAATASHGGAAKKAQTCCHQIKGHLACTKPHCLHNHWCIIKQIIGWGASTNDQIEFLWHLSCHIQGLFSNGSGQVMHLFIQFKNASLGKSSTQLHPFIQQCRPYCSLCCYHRHCCHHFYVLVLLVVVVAAHPHLFHSCFCFQHRFLLLESLLSLLSSLLSSLLLLAAIIAAIVAVVVVVVIVHCCHRCCHRCRRRHCGSCCCCCCVVFLICSYSLFVVVEAGRLV